MTRRHNGAERNIGSLDVSSRFGASTEVEKWQGKGMRCTSGSRLRKMDKLQFPMTEGNDENRAGRGRCDAVFR